MVSVSECGLIEASASDRRLQWTQGGSARRNRRTHRALVGGLAIFAATALALAGAAPAPARPHAKRPCRPSGSHTLGHSRQVRVYVDYNNKVFACLVPKGQRKLLGIDDDYNTFKLYAIAGTQVAFGTDHVPECKAACPPGISASGGLYVINARGGNARRVGDPPAAGKPVLTPTGGIAFLASAATGGGYNLIADDAEGSRVLDTGMIDPASLSLQGSLVNWTNAGQPKNAALG